MEVWDLDDTASQVQGQSVYFTLQFKNIYQNRLQWQFCNNLCQDCEEPREATFHSTNSKALFGGASSGSGSSIVAVLQRSEEAPNMRLLQLPCFLSHFHQSQSHFVPYTVHYNVKQYYIVVCELKSTQIEATPNGALVQKQLWLPWSPCKEPFLDSNLTWLHDKERKKLEPSQRA